MGSKKFILPLFELSDARLPKFDPGWRAKLYWEKFLENCRERDVRATDVLLSEYSAAVITNKPSRDGEPWSLSFGNDNDRTMFLLKFS